MGVVRTNARIISSSGSGGANGVDLPTHLSSISANGGNKFVTLSFGYTNTNYVSGVQINYKTGSYPTSPSDGQSMTVAGAATSINVTGLTNSVTYYFRVFLYNEVNGVKYYQTDLTNARITGVPRTVEVTGIALHATGADHLVITTSGTFNLTAPSSTRLILGGGAYGTRGGTVSNPIAIGFDCNNAPCTLTIANVASSNAYPSTVLKIYNATTKAYVTFSSGNTKNDVRVVSTKWGPIGGDGGTGVRSGTEEDWFPATTPTGAGGGGAGEYNSRGNSKYRGTAGGNQGGYGNHGGAGGYYSNSADRNDYYGRAGSSGAEQREVGTSTQYGNGGGGGYAAGGGSGYYYDDTQYDDDDEGVGGNPGTGIAVFEWDA